MKTSSHCDRCHPYTNIHPALNHHQSYDRGETPRGLAVEMRLLRDEASSDVCRRMKFNRRTKGKLSNRTERTTPSNPPSSCARHWFSVRWLNHTLSSAATQALIDLLLGFIVAVHRGRSSQSLVQVDREHGCASVFCLSLVCRSCACLNEAKRTEQRKIVDRKRRKKREIKYKIRAVRRPRREISFVDASCVI